MGRSTPRTCFVRFSNIFIIICHAVKNRKTQLLYELKWGCFNLTWIFEMEVNWSGKCVPLFLGSFLWPHVMPLISMLLPSNSVFCPKTFFVPWKSVLSSLIVSCVIFLQLFPSPLDSSFYFFLQFLPKTLTVICEDRDGTNGRVHVSLSRQHAET
jgi:hypothetical protein